MAKKKVVAATTIVHNGETIKPGEEIQYDKFTKDQLTRLYERGAVVVEEGKSEEPATLPEPEETATKDEKPKE